MQYIIVDKEKASRLGVASYGHLQKDEKMIVNEKALNVVNEETLAERVAAVDGALYSEEEIKNIIKQGGWS